MVVKKSGMLGLLLGFGLASWASATGILIPKEPDLAPLAIKHQRVTVQIENQVARTHVEQVFQNSVNRDLEATYIFPLPKGAAVTEFAMYIGGKRVSGQLLPKDKARKIYEDIVRRMKDPGLLEYMESDLFKVRVYPVPKRGQQRIEIRYSETLELDAGICRYVYPLKTGEMASRTLEDFTLSVDLKSKAPLKSIYSPTHKVGITRKDDHHAVIGFEEQRSLLDRDFVLYHTVSEKDVGLNMIAHREKGEHGYFMLMITPKTELDEKEIVAKDICFVIDTSGSMSGKKIEQARAALKYCLQNLNSKDRFELIRFSTTADGFAGELVPANEEQVNKALAFVDKMRATGGTAIDEALKQALSLKHDPKRPYIIAFLTDGKPTVGVTQPGEIVGNVKDRNKANVRVFVFGVGHDVDTHLLDRISETTRGYSEYVKPNEDIEVKVSLFYNKVSKPVLAGVKLDLPKVRVFDMYPREMPDLFKGTQLTLFGRHREAGDVAITITGTVNGKPQKYVYEATFPKEQSANEFIKRLWATRKVGYLLDEIRLHGEKPELKDEVVRLSREFNIITPYTSYLVVEDKEVARLPRGSWALRTYAADDMMFVPSAAEAGAGASQGRRAAKPSVAAEPQRKKSSGLTREDRRRVSEVLRQISEQPEANWEFDLASPSIGVAPRSGKGAVRIADELQRMKRDATIDEGARRIAAVKRVKDRALYRISGTWVDEGYKEGMKETKIKYASAAYFDLLKAKPAWKKFFMLGDKLILVTGKDTCLIIGDEGKEKLSTEEMDAIVRGKDVK